MTQSGHGGDYAASLHSRFLRDNFREDRSLGDLNAPTSSNGIALRAIFRWGGIRARCVRAVARINEGHRTEKMMPHEKAKKMRECTRQAEHQKIEMKDRSHFINECVGTK